MKKTIFTVVILLILGLFVLSIVRHATNVPPPKPIPSDVIKETASHLPPLGKQATQNEITVTSPSAGEVIYSPVKVSGMARGGWFFEASAPVNVIDLNGALLGTGHIEAQGDWMTSEMVPFTGSITFKTVTGSTAGILLFENDNPSGMASTSKYLAVPVVFANQ
jgi:hypothetical protein